MSDPPRDTQARRSVDDQPPRLALLEEFLQAAPLGVALVDANLVITAINTAMARLLKIPAGEALGRPLVQLLAPTEEHQSLYAVATGSASPAASRAQVRCRRCDGSAFWAEIGFSAVGDDRGHLIIVNDVTASRTAAWGTLVQHELGIALGGVKTMQAALELILDAAIAAAGMDCGGVYVVDPGTGAVDLLHAAGLSEAFVEACRHYEGDSTNAALIAAGRPIYTDYTQLKSSREQARRAEKLHSLALVPIVHAGRSVACLNIASRHLEEVPREAREALEIMAGQIGAILRRVQTEEVLRASEARLASLFRAAPVGIGVVVNRLFREVNQRLCVMVGYRREELLEQSSRILYPTDEEYAYVGGEKQRQIKETGTATLETRWQHRDGRIIDILLRSTHLDPGDPSAGITFTAMDITARKRTEALVRSQRDLALDLGAATNLEETLRHCLDFAIRVGGMDAGSIYLLNEQGGALDLMLASGLSPEFIAGGEHYPAASDHARAVAQGTPLYASGAVLQGLLSDCQQSEGLRTLAVIPAQDQGRVIGCLNVASHVLDGIDPTVQTALEGIVAQIGSGIARARAAEELRIQGERHRAELEQRVQERTVQLEAANRELEAFAYSVSHDLRAPLRSMDGFSQALLEDCHAQLDTDGQEHLHRIRRAAQRMGRMIDDILTLAQAARVEIAPRRIDLAALAAGTLSELREAEPTRQIEATIAPDMIVHSDPRLLQQIMDNLLGNAWKFSSRRAVARIEVGSILPAEDATESARIFFVRDNGVGFDMAYAKKLFGPFQRLHAEHDFPGSGIGLATVARIVERLEGRVWAEGRVDFGATVYFTLGDPAS